MARLRLKNKNSILYNKSDSFFDKLLTVLLLPFRIFLYYFLMQFVFRIAFRLFHRVQFCKNGHKLPKQFLVLCNHASNWDGIYLNTYLKRFIYFIMHDEIYKYRFSKVLAYNLLGQIKRGRNKQELTWLRQLRDTAAAGKSIGIFPEGDISYTGKSLAIDPSIIKLAKMLKLPLVLARVDGESLRWPRWSRRARKCKFFISLTDVVDAEFVKKATAEQLGSRILSGITYNDELFRRSNTVRVKGRRLAEKLERVLFMCPDCLSHGDMRSKGDRFFCGTCGHEVCYRDARLVSVRGKNHIDNLYDWDCFQRKNLDAAIDKCAKDGTHIFMQTDINLYRPSKNGFFYKPCAKGTLILGANRISFIKDETMRLDFVLADIRDMYVQFKGALEFCCGGQRYRFKSACDEHYGYLYECFIKRIQSLSPANACEPLIVPAAAAQKATDKREIPAVTNTADAEGIAAVVIR